MKTTLLLSLLCCGLASAEFANWTSKDGKTAELELTSVSTLAGNKVGEFKTKGGKTVTLREDQLSDQDAARLAAWTPPSSTAAKPAAATANASVFDKVIDKDLVRLSGKSLKRYEDATKPTKYYLFYYTASWCVPCHKFTPSVVDFYNKNKPGHDEFELVLITSDSDEGAMKDYAVEMKMPWPQLVLRKAEKFKKEFPYKVDGIPHLVLADLQGNVISEGQADVLAKLQGMLK